jgi:triacylglycerol lipase
MSAIGRVVALHGILRRGRSMGRLARYLEGEGYEVFCPDYPSTSLPLEGCAESLCEEVKAFNAGNPGLLHFVTHSMGGLVTRVYLEGYRPENLGRVVMIAPPNRGSEVADHLVGSRIYQRGFGPAGLQLTTGFAPTLPVPDCPVGIIAGTRWIDPFAALVLPGRHDGRVTVERTRLKETDPVIEIPASHPVLPLHPRVHRVVASFLASGRFGG